ncbi:GNAT family N-acetyltransferase [Maritimibacter sp. DP1N21-5]|uniref:GNAT family N-acetyltransferase n=1 Tax=Maritimibacter sp. DP1N21-5 TaxID=2836867 RepID=UPI001C438E4C|nr:GNAT family N-acetyltransferase [Maritimibacter sp. DP1N21-5]MBV7409492.1 GNAT family N-acetyltransferase [Maritimibacter sp. DP1N21-5]
MDDIVFRDYVTADFEALAVLWRDSVRVMGVDEIDWPGMEFFREKLAEILEGGEVTVADQDGRILGFLNLKPDEGVLDQLFLDPRVLRSGLGTAFFARACARMPEGFTLYKPSANQRARAFYLRMGMVETHEAAHHVWGHPITFYAWQPAAT